MNILVSITEFRRNFADFLEKVKLNDTVTITKHGKPIAVMVPMTEFAKMITEKEVWLKGVSS